MRTYYVRLHWRQGGSKRTAWKSLRTDRLSTAKLRVKDQLAAHRQKLGAVAPQDRRDITFRELYTALKHEYEHADIPEKTRSAKLDALRRLHRAWPAQQNCNAATLTRYLAEEWTRRLKTLPLRPPPPGSKGVARPLSSSSVNQALAALKAVGTLAVQRGLIAYNVAEKLPRARVSVAKVTELPALSALEKLLFELRHPRRRSDDLPADRIGNMDTADFAEGLVFTGCRISELRELTWGDIYWDRNQIHVRGTKSTTSDRIVPLIPPARTLLERMRKAREKEPMSAKVFRRQEIGRALTAACERAGITRLTHHDFRHFFVTLCIESGVDFKTIAEWVGHSDGGVLVAKTYGHLRDEHSQASAAKVTFGTG